MKKKISVSVSEDVLDEVDRVSGPGARSAVVEEALEAYLRERRRREIEEHDEALLDRFASVYDEVALDVLDFQVLPGDA